jgi:hypothetical protein
VADIVAFIQEHWNKIGPIVFGVLDYVKTYIVSYLRVIRDIINVAMALLRGDWSAVWNGIKQIVVDVFVGILNTIKAYLTMWKAVFSAGLAAFAGIMRDAMNGALGAVKLVGGKIVDWLSGLGGKMASAVKGGALALIGAGQTLGKSLVNGVISAWNMLDLSIPGFHINTHIPGVGTVGWDGIGDIIPDLPYLAKGGIVTGPASGYLAMLHGTERVVPLGRDGSPSRGDTYIDVSVSVDYVDATSSTQLEAMGNTIAVKVARALAGAKLATARGTA